MNAKDQFDGAIFEGVLLGAMETCGRGSSFGTYLDCDISVYDPLNPSNIMTSGTLPSLGMDADENRPSP